MKIEFRKETTSNQEGVMEFGFAPLQDSEQKKFRTLMLRNATHDSWVLVWNGWLREESTYIKESWARASQTAMGHLTAHRRWVHLYVDGLYWGIYDFGERVNEDFMRDYSQADAQYDVLKQFGTEDGDSVAWQALITRANAAKNNPNDAAMWTQVTEMIDLDNYIDYLMINMYMRNTDWPGNNWRAARRKDLDDRTDPNNVIYASAADAQRFRFLIWDAEYSMQNAGLTADHTGVSGGAAAIHGILLTHPTYKQAWKDRVATSIRPAVSSVSTMACIPPLHVSKPKSMPSTRQSCVSVPAGATELARR